jgi:putative zinc finger protein
MNCNEVIPLLSPYHDGELPPEHKRAVAVHLAICADCTGKLESLRRLSDLVEASPTPAAPAGLVAKVERALKERPSFWSRLPFSQQPGAAIALAALAAVLLVGVMLWRSAGGPAHGHEQMVRDFGEFLAAYEQGKPAAVDILATKYEGSPVDEAAAAAALKHATVARPIVLAGYQASKRYLLKMPCCNCVETVYTCDGRTSLVLFEHEKEQSEWFAARPMVRAECHGKACCVVQLSGKLAATWPVAGGFVTAVGLRDVDELGQLVEELHPL